MQAIHDEYRSIFLPEYRAGLNTFRHLDSHFHLMVMRVHVRPYGC